jgi:hypothetical protein
MGPAANTAEPIIKRLLGLSQGERKTLERNKLKEL